VKFLEMNHLLTGDGSVAREKADGRFGSADFSLLVTEIFLPVVTEGSSMTGRRSPTCSGPNWERSERA
jgi:hypothetical protein